jgi:copper transport protein
MSRLLRLLVAVVVLMSPARAWAHAHLKRSDPAAGAHVSDSLKAIRLWFSERPEITMTLVTLTDATGRQITLGSPQSNSGEPLEVSVPVLQSLPAGRYTLSWRTAASDGHPTHGSFGFIVVVANASPVGPSGVSAAGPSVGQQLDTEKATSETQGDDDTNDAASPTNSLARALSFLGLLVVIGATTFRMFVIGRMPSITAAMRARMGLAAAAMGLLASVVIIAMSIARIYLESQMMHAEPGMAAMSMSAMAMHTQWGSALRLAIGMALVAVAGFAAAHRGVRFGWPLATVAALALALTPALAGHAAASATHTLLLIVTDILHVLGAGSWLGTLLCVMLIGIPAAFTLDGQDRWSFVATIVNAFSPIALVSAGVVVTSGVLASWVHLETVSALWTTAYGQVLLVKVLLVAITLSIGAYNFRKVQPRLASEAGTARLRRSASAELGVGLLVLIVTGFLTGISP